MYQPGMGAGGGAAGAGLGSLGRSPLLDLLKPLDYPRQALWNMVRGGGRLAGGEGSLDDLLGMVPGLAGAGMAALGPLGMLGGTLAGGAVQGLGKMTGSDAFEASTPQDITGSEDFLPNLAVGAATDPLTYTGLGFGRHAPVPESAAAQQAGRMKMGLAPEYTGGEGGLLGPSRQPLLDPIYHAHPLEGLDHPPLPSAPQIPDVPPLPPGSPLSGGIPEAPYGPPLPEQIHDVPPLSPDQAFEQMLPDYAKYQRTQAAVNNPRNALPERFEGLSQGEMDTVRDVPTARLPEFLQRQEYPGAPLPNEEIPATGAQFRRHNAAQYAHRGAGLALEQHAPLAAQLAKSGQLGPIESRLQTNWGILGDMAQDQYLTPQQLLQQARTAQLEDQAFRTLFQRTPTGNPQGWAGQQAILDQLLADPAHAGQAAALGLEARLREGAAQTIEDLRSPLEAELGSGNYLPQGRFNELGDQISALTQRESALYNGPESATVPRDFWMPGTHPSPPGPGRAPPLALPEQLLQDLRAQGTPPGMFAGNPAYPGQPYAGLGGPSPPPVTNPLANLDPSYHGALPGATNLGTHPLEDVGFTSNPFTQPGPADLHGMDLLQHELQGMVPQRAETPVPLPPAAAPPAAVPLPTGGPIPARIPSPLREPPLDWAPPRPRGVDLEVQGQFAPGSQQGLGQFIEQLQENLGRPLTPQERALMMQMPPQRMQQVLQTPPADLENLLRAHGRAVNANQLDDAIARAFANSPFAPGQALNDPGGLRMLEQTLGRRLTHAEMDWLAENYHPAENYH